MDLNEIKNLLHEDFKDSFLFFEEIDSTNTYCKNNYRTLHNNTVVLAKHQSAGKGKNNRKWSSPKGGLYFSILLKNNNLNINTIKLLPLITSVAVFKSLKSLKVDASIKWPNDILINTKKICGILVESKISLSSIACVVIGIGLNVNSLTENIDLEHKEFFTSLKSHYHKDFSKEELFSSIINNFQYLLSQYFDGEKDSILKIYRENSLLLNKTVTLYNNNTEKEVTVLDVTDTGQLKVLSNNSIEYINSGEFSISKDSLK